MAVCFKMILAPDELTQNSVNWQIDGGRANRPVQEPRN